MKIGRIVLVALGIALLALGVRGLVEIPGRQAVLEAAVYLDEPVALPENEGRLVIVHGRPEMISPVYDEELKLTIDSIKAYRYKETYKQTSNTDEEIKWEWVTGAHTALVGRARIGAFEMDAEILGALPAESDYTAFDPAETRDYVLTRKSTATGEVCLLPDGGYYADSQVTSINDSYFNWLGAHYVAERLEGKTAYRYKYYDPEKNGESTIAGIQQNGRLVTDKAIGPMVRSGILTKQQMLASGKGGIIGGAAVFMLIGAVLVFLGIRKTKTKEA